MTQQLSNWSENYRFSAASYCAPGTVEEIQERVRRNNRVKVLGTRHSFNAIADCPVELLSLGALDSVTDLDTRRRTVTVGAGARFGHLCTYLHAEGFALANLASLPHISVAGACATATHGSGDNNAVLASSVVSLDMVTADGNLVTVSRAEGGGRFAGVVVGLGALGVVTALTLEVIPTFDVRQYVYEGLTFDEMESHFDDIMSSAYSVSLFTDWRQPEFNSVWRKTRVGDQPLLDPAAPLFGAVPASRDVHPIPGLDASQCTAQLGVQGPWHERLAHFRMDFTPSSGEELQSEYLLPRHQAVAALRALQPLHTRIADAVLVSEFRTVASDQFWMSPCGGRDNVAIHFTWKRDWPTVGRLLPLIEARLTPFDPRPHWGKLFTMDPRQVQQHYEKLPEFRALVGDYDPCGKFGNEFLDTYVLT